MPLGDTANLSARVLDEEGEGVTGATATWSSSNTAVATVNSFGVMAAVGEGTVTLAATATVSSSSTQQVRCGQVARLRRGRRQIRGDRLRFHQNDRGQAPGQD